MKRLLLALGVVALGLAAMAWVFTIGPAGTRPAEEYAAAFAAKYQRHRAAVGHAGRVSACRSIYSGLEVYGPPGYYSCRVESATHCLIDRGSDVTDLGVMSHDFCVFLIND